MRILDISNAGAYAIGAYVSFFFLLQTGSPIVALVMGVALTAVFGFLVQKFLYAPLMNKSPNVSLIAGIGLFIFLQDFPALWGRGGQPDVPIPGARRVIPGEKGEKAGGRYCIKRPFVLYF